MNLKYKALNKIALFENQGIRREWHNEQWYFAVADIIRVLTQSSDPRNYWKVLKNRLKAEGSEVVTNCNQLKMQASDGKYYSIDAADLETIFRLIQSVPSPKAEVFKLWLARLGKERVEEIQDPELAVTRAKETYKKKGYPEAWIEKRLRSIHVRNTLTDEWKNRGVKAGNEFAILTDEIYKGTFDMKAKEYKDFKSLDRENNLRDHMADLELILTMVGEATTTRVTQEKDSEGFVKLKKDAETGGAVAGRTRKDIEKQIGKSVVTNRNFLGSKKEKLHEMAEEVLKLTKSRPKQRPLDVSPKAHHYDEK